MGAVLRVVNNCRICGLERLTPVCSLGDLYISGFLEADEDVSADLKAPLELILCEPANGGCGLLQLKHTVSPDALYRNYWYRSGVNKIMTDELADIARKVESIASLRSGDFVIDIGSNDSTLLRAYKVTGLNTVGFEPAENLVQKYGLDGVTEVIADFFNFSAWEKRYGDRKAKAITAVAMFYDLDDPNRFVGDLVKCLADDGVFVIQMMYLPLFLSRNAFDGICHEHLEYYSLFSLENLLKRHGLEVFDVEVREHINEGSFRVYIRKAGAKKSLNVLPGAADRVDAMRRGEKELGLSDKKTYDDFAVRVESIKKQTVDFIKSEVEKGKKIYVYGASTKGNTLLQYFGLNNSLIPAAAERNPDKWGKKTVGTNIPIISEEQARAEKLDYFLILPWHFIEEFRKREVEYLKNGGKFIVPLPNFEIIDKA